MVFTRRLREGVRQGRIRCSIRFWQHPHVKAGGAYPMDDGRIVVDSIVPIRRKDITSSLAKESGFASVKDLLETAKHGPGENIYLIRFRYLPPGGWDMPKPSPQASPAEDSKADRLRRIRASRPATATRRKKRAV